MDTPRSSFIRERCTATFLTRACESRDSHGCGEPSCILSQRSSRVDRLSRTNTYAHVFLTTSVKAAVLIPENHSNQRCFITVKVVHPGTRVLQSRDRKVSLEPTVDCDRKIYLLALHSRPFLAWSDSRCGCFSPDFCNHISHFRFNRTDGCSSSSSLLNSMIPNTSHSTARTSMQLLSRVYSTTLAIRDGERSLSRSQVRAEFIMYLFPMIR